MLTSGQVYEEPFSGCGDDCWDTVALFARPWLARGIPCSSHTVNPCVTPRLGSHAEYLIQDVMTSVAVWRWLCDQNPASKVKGLVPFYSVSILFQHTSKVQADGRRPPRGEFDLLWLRRCCIRAKLEWRRRGELPPSSRPRHTGPRHTAILHTRLHCVPDPSANLLRCIHGLEDQVA